MSNSLPALQNLLHQPTWCSANPGAQIVASALDERLQRRAPVYLHLFSVDDIIKKTFDKESAPLAQIVRVGDIASWKSPTNVFRTQWNVQSIPTIIRYDNVGALDVQELQEIQADHGLHQATEVSRLVDSDISAEALSRFMLQPYYQLDILITPCTTISLTIATSDVLHDLMGLKCKYFLRDSIKITLRKTHRYSRYARVCYNTLRHGVEAAISFTLYPLNLSVKDKL